MRKVAVDDRIFYIDEDITTLEKFKENFSDNYAHLDFDIKDIVIELDFNDLMKILNEMNTAGDVATIEIPIGRDGTHYKKPMFDVSKREMSDLIKKKKIPKRVKNYVILNRTNNVYMKNKDTKLSFNISKFFSIDQIINGK